MVTLIMTLIMTPEVDWDQIQFFNWWPPFIITGLKRVENMSDMRYGRPICPSSWPLRWPWPQREFKFSINLTVKNGSELKKKSSCPLYELQSHGQGQMHVHYKYWRLYEGHENFFEKFPPFLIVKLIENLNYFRGQDQFYGHGQWRSMGYFLFPKLIFFLRLAEIIFK